MFDLPSASRNDERSNGVLAKSEGLCQTEMLYRKIFKAFLSDMCNLTLPKRRIIVQYEL